MPDEGKHSNHSVFSDIITLRDYACNHKQVRLQLRGMMVTQGEGEKASLSVSVRPFFFFFLNLARFISLPIHSCGVKVMQTSLVDQLIHRGKIK